jgi:hypothetical protein
VRASLAGLPRCPADGGALALDAARREGGEVEEGALRALVAGDLYAARA